MRDAHFTGLRLRVDNIEIDATVSTLVSLRRRLGQYILVKLPRLFTLFAQITAGRSDYDSG